MNNLFGLLGFPEDTSGDIDVNDPHPDIFELFVHYRDLYFDGRLDGVSVEWSSKRMTMCGGTCQKVPGGAIIKLSQPLLILRPSRDLKMVLLHEMIHAFCMVNRIHDPDPSGHGPPFLLIMARINTSTVFDFQRPTGGYNITVHHTMFNEVEYYRQHHWKCERCGDEVHRATNRRPQEADCRFSKKVSFGHRQVCNRRCRWHVHLRQCGGDYIKIKEPEGYVQKGKMKRKAEDGSGGSFVPVFSGQRSITGWLNPPSLGTDNAGTTTLPALDAVLQQGNNRRRSLTNEAEERPQLPASVQARRALFEAAALRRAGQQAPAHNSNLVPHTNVDYNQNKQKQKQQQQQVEVIDLVEDDFAAAAPPPPLPPAQQREEEADKKVNCPLCGAQFPANNNAALNSHLDECLAS